MKENILNSIHDSVRALNQLSTPSSLQFIESAAYMIANAFKQGKKVIAAGNGGSLCDAAHFAEELTGNFRQLRPALPAIALAESGHLTCVGNDMGFEYIFSRGVEAFGQEGDVFIGLTTSGNSANIIKAFEKAKDLKLRTIAFLGKGGGKLKNFAELELCIDGFSTSDRIQEAHKAAIHILIEMIEKILFTEKCCSKPFEEIVKIKQIS